MNMQENVPDVVFTQEVVAIARLVPSNRSTETRTSGVYGERCGLGS